MEKEKLKKTSSKPVREDEEEKKSKHEYKHANSVTSNNNTVEAASKDEKKEKNFQKDTSNKKTSDHEKEKFKNLKDVTTTSTPVQPQVKLKSNPNQNLLFGKKDNEIATKVATKAAINVKDESSLITKDTSEGALPNSDSLNVSNLSNISNVSNISATEELDQSNSEDEWSCPEEKEVVPLHPKTETTTFTPTTNTKSKVIICCALCCVLCVLYVLCF